MCIIYLINHKNYNYRIFFILLTSCNLYYLFTSTGGKSGHTLTGYV